MIYSWRNVAVQSGSSLETSFTEELTLVTRVTTLRIVWVAWVKNISIFFTKELNSSNPRVVTILFSLHTRATRVWSEQKMVATLVRTCVWSEVGPRHPDGENSIENDTKISKQGSNIHIDKQEKMKTIFEHIKHLYHTLNLYYGNQYEQLLKGGGHSGSFDITNKKHRAKFRASHKVIQHRFFFIKIITFIKCVKLHHDNAPTHNAAFEMFLEDGEVYINYLGWGRES